MRYSKIWIIIVLVSLINLTAIPILGVGAGHLSLISTEKTIPHFLPLVEGTVYTFGGEGNEYAPFRRVMQIVDGDHAQIYDNNGGTVIALVYQVTDQNIVMKKQIGEFYEEDMNLIPDVKDKKENGLIVLKGPLEVGHQWETNGQTRTIVALMEPVTVPAGTFTDTIKIEARYPDHDMRLYEYYAVGIGLVLREFVGDDFQVTSFLESIQSK